MPGGDGWRHPDTILSAIYAGAEPGRGAGRNVKKATANTLYENTSDMAGAIRRMIMSGEIIKAKISHYLTP